MGVVDLAARAAELGTDHYDPVGLIAEFRDSPVLVPTTSDGRWWTADLGGIRWLYAFTGPDTLARFAAERLRDAGAPSPTGTAPAAAAPPATAPATDCIADTADAANAGWPYVTVHGARLLDIAVPAVGVPAGVVLDVAGPSPAFLPPVTGIVPDSVAVDRARGGSDGR
ncbi:hypothetical protein [Kitasatospora sp. NPDC050543]|uniref:hypothetical protein n=1 Tax=Kitasatospora sp. NPDC050543 TaxID=3364054 RepID=UPI0037A00AE4